MARTNARNGDVAQRLLGLLLHLRSGESESKARGATRVQIVEYAMSEFARRGYAGTSMRQIAAACGIKAASLYSHFPEGKDELLREGLRVIYDEFLSFLVAPLRDGMDDETALRTIVLQHIHWQLTEGDKALAWDAAVQQFGVADVLDETTAAKVREHQALYHSYLEALVSAMGVEDSEGRTVAIVALCDQAQRWLDRSRGVVDQRDEVAERIWRFVGALLIPESRP